MKFVGKSIGAVFVISSVINGCVRGPGGRIVPFSSDDSAIISTNISPLNADRAAIRPKSIDRSDWGTVNSVLTNCGIKVSSWWFSHRLLGVKYREKEIPIFVTPLAIRTDRTRKDMSDGMFARKSKNGICGRTEGFVPYGPANKISYRVYVTVISSTDDVATPCGEWSDEHSGVSTPELWNHLYDVNEISGVVVTVLNFIASTLDQSDRGGQSQLRAIFVSKRPLKIT